MLAHGFQRWYRAFIANAGLPTLTQGLCRWRRAFNSAGLETLTRGFQRKHRALNANTGISMLVQGFLALMGKELLAELKRAIFKNWLKIHPKVVNALKPEANPSFLGHPVPELHFVLSRILATTAFCCENLQIQHFCSKYFFNAFSASALGIFFIITPSFLCLDFIWRTQ